jgi:hypothetical protein
LTRSRLTLALAATLAATLLAPGPASAQPRDFFGVGNQGDLHRLGSDVGANDFNMMQGARVGSLRFILNWEQFSPGGPYHSQGQPFFDFGQIDRVVGGAGARGIRVVPFFYKPHTGLGSKDQRDAMLRFVAAIVERYSPGGTYWTGPFRQQFPGSDPFPIVSWQIHNEMNARAHWGGTPSPRAYALALRAAARTIRQQHKRAEIVLGGMFCCPRGRGSLDSWQYLNRLYRVRNINVKRFFDTVAIHPYSPTVKGLRQQILRIRGVMRRNGHRAGQIRLTELGWGSGRGDHELLKGPEGQARLLRQSFQMLKRPKNRKRWNIRGLHWFSWQDGRAACKFCASAGLVTAERQAKPSYGAFRQAAG